MISLFDLSKENKASEVNASIPQMPHKFFLNNPILIKTLLISNVRAKIMCSRQYKLEELLLREYT